MTARKASRSASSGVMSLKTIPGLGKSGMSRMWLVRSRVAWSFMAPPYHIGEPGRARPRRQRREVVEGVAGDVVLADLEVEIGPGRLAGHPDRADHVALLHDGADRRPVLAVVGVDGGVPVAVR